jgi:hypothetical protein
VPPHPLRGQCILRSARASSADSAVRTMIIGRYSGYEASAWSITSCRGSGQIVLVPNGLESDLRKRIPSAGHVTVTTGPTPRSRRFLDRPCSCSPAGHDPTARPHPQRRGEPHTECRSTRESCWGNGSFETLRSSRLVSGAYRIQVSPPDEPQPRYGVTVANRRATAPRSRVLRAAPGQRAPDRRAERTL